MKKYCVMIEGRNFLIISNGIPERNGFFASKVVEASDEQQAGLIAIDMIHADEILRTATRNTHNDPPTMHVDEIREITDIEATEIPTKGNTFYPEVEVNEKERPTRRCS